MTRAQAISAIVNTAADAMLHALPHPVIMVSPDGKIADANVAAEQFFDASTSLLRRHSLRELVPFGSPLLTLVDQVRHRGAAVNEYKVDLATPRNPGERLVDLYVGPLPEYPEHVIVMLQERTIADKMDRQLTHRGAARSVIALAAMLAHEIKNPLSGIRGAAQLLEQSAADDDRPLTKLICDETDRIVKLVDRMEVFADERPIDREPVNIHVILDHVKRLAIAISSSRCFLTCSRMPPKPLARGQATGKFSSPRRFARVCAYLSLAAKHAFPCLWSSA
jgi:two-component system nitrogen regulation sensor histidine kinase GlnL